MKRLPERTAGLDSPYFHLQCEGRGFYRFIMELFAKPQDLHTFHSSWKELCFRVLQDSGHAAQIFTAAGLHANMLRSLGSSRQNHESYGRRSLFRCDEYEVVLATWNRGDASAPHDHGLSESVVWIVEGSFRETHFLFNGKLQLGGATERRASDPASLHDGQDIHSTLALESGISLHVYSPPIQEMQVFDLHKRRTVTVRDGCGAWIPEDNRLILEESDWAPPKST